MYLYIFCKTQKHVFFFVCSCCYQVVVVVFYFYFYIQTTWRVGNVNPTDTDTQGSIESVRINGGVRVKRVIQKDIFY